MPRKLRTFFFVSGIVTALLVMIWFVLAWYIQEHKKELLQDITRQLNKNIQGSLHIEDMEPSFLVTLPYFSVRLKNVSLRDSMWEHHHHDLLTARRIYVQLSPLSLLKGKPTIHEVNVNDGTIYLFTDSTGYTNSYLLQRRDSTAIKSKNQAVFNKLVLEDMKIVFEDNVKHKLFHFDVDKLSGKIEYYSSGWVLKTLIKARIKQLTFNTAKGSFLKDKYLTADVQMHYDYASKTISMARQPLYLDEHLYEAKLQIAFTGVPKFEIDVSTKQIKFRDAALLTAPNISHHFDSFDLAKPADVNAIIKGNMVYRDTPLVVVQWHIKNNTLYTPIGNIERCSLDGSFTNEVVAGGNHTDYNSELNISQLKGVYQGVPFSADTVHVSNLKVPVLYCHIKANFPIQQLNTLTGSETVSFDAGNADADIIYKGGVSEDDTTHPYIKGYARIDKAGITYLPRNIAFSDVYALLQFDGSDLYIKNVRLRSGQSSIAMDGAVGNFLNLYFNSPDKILVNWNIRSPFINLNEFSSFFQKRKSYRNPIVRHYQKLRIIRKLDVVLDACNVDMQLQVSHLAYRTFAASGISANVLLTRSGIDVKYVNLSHAGGTINVSGNIVNQPAGNRSMDIHAMVNGVKIDQLFYAFANFGQNAIDAKNIKGNLTAKIDLAGLLNENAKIIPNSMQGKVAFQIDNGALIHFEPLENIGKHAFKKRNLSYVTFGSIKDELTIDHDKIIIPPVLLRTSVMNMRVDGVYAPPKNTDINLEVPLRNPKEDSAELNSKKGEKNWQKGLVLFLKATNGDDGKLKIGWDRKKGVLKNTNKEDRMERREQRQKRRAERHK
ncbi:MAG: AsmA-like C-terminal region-containing protein [Flavipsychrobacter sp.]|nr:AsmA-like C-terminal region-containing protein [Flavipsychrobacter sp.]